MPEKMTQQINWIKPSMTIFTFKFPKGYSYSEHVQVHQDGTVKVESYVSVLVGSFSDLMRGKLPGIDKTDFMSKLNKALKIESVV